MQYEFDSNFGIVGDFNANFAEETIKNEPMMFNCDLEHAYAKGGTITRQFLAALPFEWQSKVVIDTRVHMLMKGWFPAIPGYHHDDVPRNTANDQPNYDNPLYKAEHLMGLVNGDICPTLYAVGKHILPKIENDIVYKRWHPIVEEQISLKILDEVAMPSGKLIYFDWQSMHTAQRANTGGWRWFARLSRNTDRIYAITNETRRQVQVYLEFPMEGW